MSFDEADDDVGLVDGPARLGLHLDGELGHGGVGEGRDSREEQRRYAQRPGPNGTHRPIIPSPLEMLQYKSAAHQRHPKWGRNGFDGIGS